MRISPCVMGATELRQTSPGPKARFGQWEEAPSSWETSWPPARPSDPFLADAFKQWHYNELEGLARIANQTAAQLEMGWRNQTGAKAPWGERNYERAEAYYRQAAKSKDPVALFYLAEFLNRVKPQTRTVVNRVLSWLSKKPLATPDQQEAYRLYRRVVALANSTSEDEDLVLDAEWQLKAMAQRLQMPPANRKKGRRP